jgi:hypothetical protein
VVVDLTYSNSSVCGCVSRRSDPVHYVYNRRIVRCRYPAALTITLIIIPELPHDVRKRLVPVAEKLANR